MTIKANLQEAIKSAMRAKDQASLTALRLIHAAIRQREIDERIDLDDEQVLGLLDKMVKQRRESIKMYQEGGRADLMEKEQFEVAVIQQFLPQPLTDSEIDDLIQTAIAETGPAGIKDMGKLMAALRPKLQGRADMAIVSQRIKDKLG